MSACALGPSRGAAHRALAEALPGLDELAGLGAVEPSADAASVRLEPLAMPPSRAARDVPAARPIDPRARVLFESLGARAGELAAHPAATLGAHVEVLRSTLGAVSSMVATLGGLDALEREATLARRRGAVRA